MRKLESIRKDLKFTQEDMASSLSISSSSYQRKEEGKSPLLARELRKISILSGVPEAEIIIPL